MGFPVGALDPKRGYFQADYGVFPDDHGIPDQLWDVVQDREGYLWFASGGGLCRYSGINTTCFRVSVHPELLSNLPRRLFLDSKDRLFIASERGLSLLIDGKFLALNDHSPWAQTIRSFEEDSSGNLWMASEAGLWQIEADNEEAQQVTLPVESVFSLFWHEARLLVGGRGQLVSINGQGDQTAYPLPAEMSDATIWDIEYHQGRIWLATSVGVYFLNDGNVVPAPQTKLLGKAFTVVFSDRDQNLWLSTPGEIVRVFPDGRIEEPFGFTDPFGWDPSVTQIAEDVNGVLLLATRFSGLYALRDMTAARISFTENLPSANITSVAADQEGVTYIATEKGLAAVVSEDIKDALDILLEQDFAPEEFIETMLVTPDNLLWVGTPTGLRLFDLESRAWRTLSAQHQFLGNVNALAASIEGHVWAATDSGLFRATELRVDRELDLGEVRVSSLLTDASGELWAGTAKGVVNVADGVAETLTGAEGSVDVFPVALGSLPSGAMIALTAYHGIFIRSDRGWTNLTEAHGLPAQTLFDVEVRGDQVWLMSGDGIFVADAGQFDSANLPKKIELINFATPSDYRSIMALGCCRGENSADAVIADRKLAVSTDDGVVFVDLDVKEQLLPPPRIFLESVTYLGEPVTGDGNIDYLLNADQQQMLIKFSGLDIRRGAFAQYRYRLLGLNDQWIEVGDALQVQLNNLPASKFVFELQSSSYDDQWSDAQVAFSVERLPTLSESPIFKMGVWASSLLVVLAMFWLRTSAARRRQALLERTIAERTSDLNALNAKLEASVVELEHTNQTDALTGLINRRYFDNRPTRTTLPEIVAGGAFLIVLDIDLFKQINDTHGHAAGDAVLVQFARVLQTVTRDSDLVCRWGGEEFLLICSGEWARGPLLLDRISQAVRLHRFECPDGTEVSMTCSMGCVTMPFYDNHDVDENLGLLIDLADRAQYAVKSQGRDGWVMLRSGEQKTLDLTKASIDLSLSELVQHQHCVWTANRPEIVPKSDDNVTHLPGKSGRKP